MSLSNFAVNAPVKVTMIFLGVLLLGWISLTRLPTSLFPDIRTPRVTTTIKTRGLSTLEVERRICQPMERALYTIRGVSDVQSISRADTAVIITEFTWDTLLDYAFIDVKKAVSDVQRDRGEEIESATVLRYDPNAVPVVTIALKGNDRTSAEDLYKLAKNTLRSRFERLEGIANVVIAGGIEREMAIKVDETLLLAYGLDVAQVVQALQSDNVNAAGGFVEEGARRYLLKAVGEYRDMDEVASTVVGRAGESSILLKDVATLSMDPREEKSQVFLDGKPAVSMAFYQEARGNTVAVAKAIRKEADELKESLPEGVEIVIANDQSQFISAAIQDVKSNALIGAVLAVFVLVAMLRDFRTTLIISIAIPVSIIATFNLMYFQGLTLNLMSLGGLALGVGMLVDNAIVVLENIFRLRHEGLPNREAARIGTKQVGAAILASTTTTIVVFLPIIFIKGVAALLFREQALTVTYSLLASLVVALLLIPMLASRFLGKIPAGMISNESNQVKSTIYTRALRACLRFRFVVIAFSLALLLLAFKALERIPREFLPRTDSTHIGLRVVGPSGTPITGTSEIVQSINTALDQYRPAVVQTFVRIGEDEGAVGANTEDPNGANTADFFIALDNRDKPTTMTLAAGLGGFSSSQLIEKLKPSLERFEGVKADFKVEQGSILELLGTGGAPLVLEIRGSEIDELTRQAARYQGLLSQVDGIINVRTNILAGSPEVRIKLDRVQLGKLGFDVRSVGDTLRRRIEGTVATQMKREEGDLDLRVKVDYGAENLETLKRITLRSSSGAVVPLESVATFEIVRGPTRNRPPRPGAHRARAGRLGWRETIRRYRARECGAGRNASTPRLYHQVHRRRRTPRGRVRETRFRADPEHRARLYGDGVDL
jgi:HAE1 family hydrophobic/amphiphilic exporter-1